MLTCRQAVENLELVGEGHASRLEKLIFSHNIQDTQDIVDFFALFQRDDKAFVKDDVMPQWSARSKSNAFQTLVKICSEEGPIKEHLCSSLGNADVLMMVDGFKFFVSMFTKEARKPKKKSDEETPLVFDDTQSSHSEVDDPEKLKKKLEIVINYIRKEIEFSETPRERIALEGLLESICNL